MYLSPLSIDLDIPASLGVSTFFFLYCCTSKASRQVLKCTSFTGTKVHILTHLASAISSSYSSTSNPLPSAASAVRQYLYFCTSKASKVSTPASHSTHTCAHISAVRQYLYFCTSKASKRSTPASHSTHTCPTSALLSSGGVRVTGTPDSHACVSIRTVVPVKQVNRVRVTGTPDSHACVSIRTFVPVKQVNCLHLAGGCRDSASALHAALLVQQYCYKGTSKASKASKQPAPGWGMEIASALHAALLVQQYCYKGTSKSSKQPAPGWGM